MTELCRICMIPKHDLTNLVKEGGSGQLERSGEKFEDCFGIKVTELPYCQRICRSCDEQLIDFYYFKQQALRTHNYLLDKAADLQAKCADIKEEVDGDEEQALVKGNSPVEFFNIEYLDEDEEPTNVGPLQFVKKEHEDDVIKQGKYDVDAGENTGNEALDGYEQIESLMYEDQDTNESLSEDKAEDDELANNTKNQTEDKETGQISKSYFKKYKLRCNECSRNFKTEKTYQEHLKKHLEEEEYYTKRRNGDPGLDDYSPGGQGVKGRKKYKKNVERYKYICKVCNKRFLYDFSYEAHKNVHKGLSPYNCALCGKGFKLKINYTYHMKNHYNERDFKCSICDKAFLVRWDLDLHMRSHTDARPYICDICGKGFRISCHLTSHRETHNETNIYECNLCQMKLHTKVTLTRHLASVHKIGRLKNCPFCEKQFVRLDRFKVHIGKCHGAYITDSISPTGSDQGETFIDI